MIKKYLACTKYECFSLIYKTVIGTCSGPFQSSSSLHNVALIWHQAIFTASDLDNYEVETSVTQWLIEQGMDMFQTRVRCNSNLEL